MSREAAIVSAVAFLEDPSTQSAPLGVKMKYLREKYKMTQGDIETAMTRVGTGGATQPEPAAALAAAAAKDAEVKAWVEGAWRAVLLEQPADPMVAMAEKCREKSAADQAARSAGGGAAPVSAAPALAAAAAVERTPAPQAVGMQSNHSFIKKRLQVQKVPEFLQKAAAKHQAEGVELFKAKDYEAAMYKFEAALKQNPKLTQLLSYTSQCKQKLGKLEEALAAAEECVAAEPSFVGGYKQLATAQLANGDDDKARDTIANGIKNVPANKAEPLQKMLSAALKK